MRNCTKAFLLCSAVFMLGVAGPAFAVHTFEGFLSWTNNASSGITATGQWASPTTKIAWAIDSPLLTGTGNWHYEYTFTVPNKDVSHLDVEVSFAGDGNPDTFTEADIVSTNWGNIDVGWQGTQGNNTPGIPEPFYAIKFDSATGTTVFATLDTPIGPKWGDFYAKDGVDNNNGTRIDVYAFNTGFTSPDTDPLVPPSNGPFNGSIDGKHLLVPDTSTTPPVVPEPLTMLGLLMGVGGLTRYLRNRR